MFGSDTGVRGDAAQIETVAGRVPLLGNTLMHEHVFVLTPDSQANWPSEWNEQREVDGAVAKLRELRDSGVNTIVDPTVDGLGRNIPRIQRVAERVPGLNIVVATGIYTYADVPHFFAHRVPAAGDSDPMTRCFVSDIRDGIQGTGVRAAFLKCAIDSHGMLPGVERVLRAVAAAHHETGAPIMVHTHPGSRTGDEVHGVLSEEGILPAAVVLAHSGDSTDARHLGGLAEAGYVLGMDRFGLDTILDFERRVDIVARLCEMGYADRMVLSQDASCHIDWMSPATAAALPNWHYLHVRRDVVPALRSRGVTEGQVQQMLVATPARWFGLSEPDITSSSA